MPTVSETLEASCDVISVFDDGIVLENVGDTVVVVTICSDVNLSCISGGIVTVDVRLACRPRGGIVAVVVGLKVASKSVTVVVRVLAVKAGDTETSVMLGFVEIFPGELGGDVNVLRVRSASDMPVLESDDVCAMVVVSVNRSL